MVEQIDGYPAEAHAAIEVEVGWQVVYDGAPRTVMDKQVEGKLPWQDERTVRLLVEGVGWMVGAEGQTLYKLVEPPA